MKLSTNSDLLSEKIKRIKLLLTDCDGVLTDNGVYYDAQGEVMKRFSIRDGMGVERLRQLCGIDTGIVTGEGSPSLIKRAEKLKITELHLSIKDKVARIHEIANRLQLNLAEIAYIGDDTIDVDLPKIVGLRACPADATIFVKPHVDYICQEKGGYGALREFAELIIQHQTSPQ